MNTNMRLGVSVSGRRDSRERKYLYFPKDAHFGKPLFATAVWRTVW